MLMCLISDSLTIMFPDLYNDLSFFFYLAYNPKVPGIYKCILGETMLTCRNLPREIVEKLHL